jgi:hypothetical protein
VPAQQGFGGDEEATPPAARQESAERREDRPIRQSVLDTLVHLTFKNTNLVAEHHELDVLVGISSTHGTDETKRATEAEIQQGEDHVGWSPTIDGKRQSRAVIVVLVPFSPWPQKNGQLTQSFPRGRKSRFGHVQ